ncbi:MAG: alpha/beta fold hydrolase [Desulfobacterales bacterium]|nr:alpha/beta fold hydrolase [Desulfobacterales bacterium]
MLRFKRYGAGPPLLLLHGLFGSADGWHPVAKALGEDFAVHAIDQRNHGASVHSAHMDYDTMAEDARDLMTCLGLGRAGLIGHSMGGKTAMRFASRFPEMTAALVVVDIAPRGYPPIHAGAIEALARLDLGRIPALREAEAALAPAIPDPILRRFLLKSLDRTPEGGFRWKVNLSAVRRAYPTLCAPLTLRPWPGPCLFVRGAASDYITDGDWAAIRSVFPQARLATIPGAGHWVQADDPAAFIRTVSRFFLEAAALNR